MACRTAADGDVMLMLCCYSPMQCPPEAKFVPLNGNTISPVHHENVKIMTRSEINNIPSWDQVCVHACVCAVGMYT